MNEPGLRFVEISVEQDAQATELFYDYIDDDEDGGYKAAREIIYLRDRVRELESDFRAYTGQDAPGSKP